MDRRSRNIAWFLLVLFAMFFCGNTLFVHTHRLFDGQIETHSHPFLPGSAHSHSDAGFQAIAQINAALAVIDREPLAETPRVPQRKVRRYVREAVGLRTVFTVLRKGRAPPIAA